MDTFGKLILSEYGAIAATATIFIGLCWFLLKHILSDHKDDRKKWLEIVKKQNCIIGNHIDHLTKSTNNMAYNLKRHDDKSAMLSKQIVDAINNQTEMMKIWREKHD